MEHYDLSTITRDQLQFLLSTAKDEMVKYTCCREQVEKCEKSIEEEKKKVEYIKMNKVPTLIGKIMCILIIIGSIYAHLFIKGYWPFWFPLIMCFVGIILFFIGNPKLKEFKNAPNNIKKYQAQLLELKSKEKESMNEFRAVLFIPNDYCYEYALAKMLKFMENKQASNWERVTDLYEEHLHRMTMEDNARQSLALSKLQAEYAKEGRDAARWAAAGAWAAAAGIWRR